MAQINPIVDKSEKKLREIIEHNVDGPETLVAEAILRGTDSVKNLALNGGLVSNRIRQIAWPFLLSDRILADDKHDSCRDEKTEKETFRQIELDVPRSVSQPYRNDLEKFLKDFFTQHQDLCFYQGFADLAFVVYRVMTDNEVMKSAGEAQAHFVLGRLSRHFLIRDAHRPTFDAIYCALNVVKGLISRSDREIAKVWERAEANEFWAISPLVCLFSHDLDNVESSARILDAVIAMENNVEFPIYLVASIAAIPDVRSKMLEQGVDAADMHEALLTACRDSKNIDALVDCAHGLLYRVPLRLAMKNADTDKLPRDSLLARTVSLAETVALTKKRSWRTFTFFSTTLEIGF